MIRIDMTEEPEDENDLIFKAQNLYGDDKVSYELPIQDFVYGTVYMDTYYYQYLLDNFINK